MLLDEPQYYLTLNYIYILVLSLVMLLDEPQYYTNLNTKLKLLRGGSEIAPPRPLTQQKKNNKKIIIRKKRYFLHKTHQAAHS